MTISYNPPTTRKLLNKKLQRKNDIEEKYVNFKNKILLPKKERIHDDLCK